MRHSHQIPVPADRPTSMSREATVRSPEKDGDEGDRLDQPSSSGYALVLLHSASGQLGPQAVQRAALDNLHEISIDNQTGGATETLRRPGANALDSDSLIVESPPRHGSRTQLLQ